MGVKRQSPSVNRSLFQIIQSAFKREPPPRTVSPVPAGPLRNPPPQRVSGPPPGTIGNPKFPITNRMFQQFQQGQQGPSSAPQGQPQSFQQAQPQGQPQGQPSFEQLSYDQISPPEGPSGELMAAIDAEYNNTLSQISSEEARVKGEEPTAVSGIQAEQKKTRAGYVQAQQEKQSQIGQREQQQQNLTQSSLEQLRQLFQETQQQQLAGLSAAGISRSSAGEAFAALLGRETAQRVSGALQSKDEVLRGLADELKRVNSFYTDQFSVLDTETDNRIATYRQALRANLSKLTGVRGQAAVAKQQQRAQAFSDYQNQVFQIQQANQQAKMALDTWKQNMALKLQAGQQLGVNLGQLQSPNLQSLAQQYGTITSQQQPGSLAIRTYQGKNAVVFERSGRFYITDQETGQEQEITPTQISPFQQTGF